MNDWILLATFYQPSEMWVIRGKLDSEGIATKVKDELTIQTDPLLSAAMGGVKLYVQKKDVAIAEALFWEADMNQFISDSDPRNSLNKWIDDKSKKIPLLGEMTFAIRFVFFALALVILTSLLLYCGYHFGVSLR
ncbi:DUF2007 domain-containing protein [Chitinophagales bacterium]|nr:DUF2007 domain-containing protein [Chitinophagales bacterium]